MSYLTAIKTAIFVFPLIAFLITIPFILIEYHKYGSINKLRSLIIYSFILYLITVYFLVILPLPDRSTLAPRSGMIRLLPFNFIKDILKESTITLNSPITYLTIFKTNAFYTTILNILMTVPFGIYLSYYFKCNLKQTVILSFFLSLFFEITQITGLYFIYRYPYRVFDTDDLIMNTLGGLLGYYLFPLFNKILPTREELDKESLKQGKKVSLLRRITVFFLDFVILSLVLVFFKNKYLKLLIFFIYYSLIPYLNKGKTLGSAFLNIKFDVPNYGLIRRFLRQLTVYIYYFKFPFFLLTSGLALEKIIPLPDSLLVIIYLILIIITAIFYLKSALKFLKTSKIFYDDLFKITIKSTIEIEE